MEHGSNMSNLTLALGTIRERVTRLAQCPLNGSVALDGAVPTVKIKNRYHFLLTSGLERLPEKTLAHHYRKAALSWVNFVLSDLCHVVWPPKQKRSSDWKPRNSVTRSCKSHSVLDGKECLASFIILSPLGLVSSTIPRPKLSFDS